MDDPHYACAPLTQWLPSLAGEQGAAVHVVDAIPRPLRALLEPLAALGPDVEGLGLLVVVGELPDPDLASVLAALRPGGWLVELVPAPRGLARTLLALRPDASRAVASGYRAAVRWSGAGLCQLQQWTSPDPPDLRVTAGRRRHPPAAAR